MELPCARQLARTGKELSREAPARLAWMDFYRRSRNVARGPHCRHFGISRETFTAGAPPLRFPEPSHPGRAFPPSHRRRRATWSSSGRSRPGLAPALFWTSNPCPAWSSSSSLPAMWSRAWDVVQATLAPPLRLLPSCSTPCCSACPSPFGRCKSMAKASSPRVRSRLSAARPALVRPSTPFSQTQRCGRTRQPHSHRGVLPGHGLLFGDEKTQPRTTPAGKDLQHRASAPVAGLPDPAAGSCCGAHFKERNEKCHPSTGRVHVVTSTCR